MGPTDRGRPLGRDQETNGESEARRTSQTTMPGTVPCPPAGTVLRNHPDTNSVVGAEISPYSIVGVVNSRMVRLPHMPLGIDSVVGAGIYRTE